MKGRVSGGVLGAVFGALGVLPLLPIASGMVTRLAAVPHLPGAEKLNGDVKPALYAEVLLFVLAAPLAAFFFGSLLPSILEARSRPGRLSFEWVAVGFASGFFLAMRGLRPRIAVLAGLAVAVLVAIGVREYRRSWRVRRLFARGPRRAALRLALVGASLQLARRSALGTPRHVLDDLLSELVVAGAAVAIVAALLCLWFARRPDASLRRLGDAAWVGFLGSALALQFPRAAPVLLPACLLCFPFAAFRNRASLSRLATPAAVGLLALVCGWRMLAPRVPWIDLFEEGHSLGTSQLYLSGARPFLEAIPVHGWGADGGVDTFVFRRFGATLQTFETRRAIWSVAAFALLGMTASGRVRGDRLGRPGVPPRARYRSGPHRETGPGAGGACLPPLGGANGTDLRGLFCRWGIRRMGDAAQPGVRPDHSDRRRPRAPDRSVSRTRPAARTAEKGRRRDRTVLSLAPCSPQARFSFFWRARGPWEAFSAFPSSRPPAGSPTRGTSRPSRSGKASSGATASTASSAPSRRAHRFPLSASSSCSRRRWPLS